MDKGCNIPIMLFISFPFLGTASLLHMACGVPPSQTHMPKCLKSGPSLKEWRPTLEIPSLSLLTWRNIQPRASPSCPWEQSCFVAPVLPQEAGGGKGGFLQLLPSRAWEMGMAIRFTYFIFKESRKLESFRFLTR